MSQVTLNPQQVNKIVFEALDTPASVLFLTNVIESALGEYPTSEDDIQRLNRAVARVGFKIELVGIIDRASTCTEGPTETLGARIKRLRKGSKLSQSKLAEVAGMEFNGQAMISKYERDAQTPSADILKGIATALQVDISELSHVKTRAKKVPGPKKAARFLGRDRTTFERGSKPHGIPRFTQHDDEEDDDDEPRFKRYPKAVTTGPKVLEIIQFHSITAKTLFDEFEVTPEEHERIRTQHWNDFGGRWMYELLEALNMMYTTPGQQKVFLAHQMTREQIVSELRELFAANPQLTKEELVNNFEFGEEDYEYIMANEPDMISKTMLVEYLNDVRGGIAEREIEVPN